MSGFQFQETMAGTFTRHGDSQKPMKFTARARAKSFWKHLSDHKAELDGHVDMEGFATHQPLHGEVTINPILGGLIRYEFAFHADDGKGYRFAGQKDVKLLRPVETMTTLPASIVDDKGAEVATALLHFDTRSLPGFLGSFRPLL
jgi:hypothetical protein